MAKLSCIIVDDEPLAVELMQRYVSHTSFLELKGSFNSAIEAMRFLQESTVDLIFLDIQMPELSGMEFSKLVNKRTRIVFTTAFSEYAIEGYRVNALDYLLKPFGYDEFLKAACRAKEWFEESVLSKSGVVGGEGDYIFVKSEYKQVKVYLNDIYYFEGLKDYIKIWVKGSPRPILTIASLKALEEELPVDKFMRIHRSFIIALDKIQTIERSQVVINDVHITIAQAYKDAFNRFIASKSVH